MDDVELLIQAFSARGAMASSASKLDVLLDLERLGDRRVVCFLLQGVFQLINGVWLMYLTLAFTLAFADGVKLWM
jgi:hypothetical protein